MQARSRGVSNSMVGFILGVTPLTVAVVSPLFGYFVSVLNYQVCMSYAAYSCQNWE